MRERASVVAAMIVSWALASARVWPRWCRSRSSSSAPSSTTRWCKAGAARQRAAAATVREAESAYKPHVGLNVDSNVAPGRRIIAAPDPRRRRSRDGTLVQGRQRDAEGRQRRHALLPQWRSTAMLMLGANLYDFGRTAAAVAATRAKTRVEQDRAGRHPRADRRRRACGVPDLAERARASCGSPRRRVRMACDAASASSRWCRKGPDHARSWRPSKPIDCCPSSSASAQRATSTARA